MTTTRRIIGIAAACIALTGCVSQQLHGYIGKDIREAMLKYGAPTQTIDMDDGTRAYQFTVRDESHVPGVSTGFGTGNAGVATAIHNGGYTTENECRYTFMTRQKDGGKAWIIESVKELDVFCDGIDL